MKKIVLFLFSIVSIHCWSQGKFEINGKLSGFPDSTMIYLDQFITSASSPFDSVMLMKNEFHFKGNLQQDITRMIIRTKSMEYKLFWMEPAVVSFTAEKGKLKMAEITGSKSQLEQDEFSAAVKMNNTMMEDSRAFIKSHPNSIVSANVLSTYSSTWGRDTAQVLYNFLSEKIKNTSLGKSIKDFLDLNKNIKIGDRYADFTQPDINGKNVSLSDFKGKYVLLEFWGSWCGPCRAGNPELLKTYNEFKNKGFEILGVAADENKQAWLDAVEKDGLTWSNVSDLKGDKNRAALIYGIAYYPANFLIDRNGIIVAKDLRGEELRNKLLEILK